MAKKTFHVAVKALIVNNEGNVLVFQVDPSKFLTPDPVHGDLPGGRIDVGEDPLEALQREMEEETGITNYSDVEFFTALTSPMQIPISPTEKVGLVLFVYKVTLPADSKIVLSDEHTEYAWLTPKQAAKELEFKFGKEFGTLLTASL